MIPDLATTYLGLALRSPLVVGAAAPLSEELAQLPALERAGAAAIVLHSLFEEQIEQEQLDLHRHAMAGADSYGEALTYVPEPSIFHGGEDLYLRQLEQVVIDLLAGLDLHGERIDGLTGVWLEGRKVAAIGVGARRWISQHGLALNVDGNLAGFAAVVPCGLGDRGVGRLVDWLPGLNSQQLRRPLLEAFASRFGLVLRPPGPQEEVFNP